MKKRIITLVIAYLLIIGSLYVMFALPSKSWDIFEWHTKVAVCFSVLFFVFTLLAVLIWLHLIDD